MHTTVVEYEDKKLVIIHNGDWSGDAEIQQWNKAKKNDTPKKKAFKLDGYWHEVTVILDGKLVEKLAKTVARDWAISVLELAE